MNSTTMPFELVNVYLIRDHVTMTSHNTIIFYEVCVTSGQGLISPLSIGCDMDGEVIDVLYSTEA